MSPLLAPADATHRSQKNGKFYKFVGDQLMVWQATLNPGWFKSLNDAANLQILPLLHQPDPVPTWTGEGLPPVGTDCQYSVGDCDSWFYCTVRYIIKPIQDEPLQIVVDCPHLAGEQVCSLGDGPGEIRFRPIRTPEQIAADEREQAAIDLHRTIHPGAKWDKLDGGMQASYRAAITLGWAKKAAAEGLCKQSATSMPKLEGSAPCWNFAGFNVVRDGALAPDTMMVGDQVFKFLEGGAQ